MIEHILDSKVKMKLMAIFREKPSFTVSGAAVAADVSKSRASECLKDLAGKGILESMVIGKSVVYSLSSTVLSKKVMESLHVEDSLSKSIFREFLKEARGTKLISAAVFGSSAYGIKFGGDMDFFVISDKKEPFYAIAADLTEKIGITISVLVMDIKEFREKVKRGEEFAINLMANHKLIYGKKLEELVWQEK